MAGKKKPGKTTKIVAIVLGIFLVNSFILLVMGRMEPILFFVVAGIIALMAYTVIPKMK